jgi:hypothetical protein
LSSGVIHKQLLPSEVPLTHRALQPLFPAVDLAERTATTGGRPVDHPALPDLNQNKSLQTILAISYFYCREFVVPESSSNKNLHSFLHITFGLV